MHEDLVQTHAYKSKNKFFVNDKDILRVFSLGVARRLKIVEDSIILTYIPQTPEPPLFKLVRFTCSHKDSTLIQALPL